MTAKCPYCGGPLNGEHALPLMSQRRKRIYSAVVNSGSDGIPAQQLLPHMYEPGQPQSRCGHTVLRVQIHELNKLLSEVGQRITAKPYGAYRLFSTGVLNGSSS